MIDTYRITTGSGMLNNSSSLPFLTAAELKEFDQIGYTGKNFKGERTNYEAWLNTLDKGEFKVDCTKHDTGDFYEQFTITRVSGGAKKAKPVTELFKIWDECYTGSDHLFNITFEVVDGTGADAPVKTVATLNPKTREITYQDDKAKIDFEVQRTIADTIDSLEYKLAKSYEQELYEIGELKKVLFNQKWKELSQKNWSVEDIIIQFKEEEKRTNWYELNKANN